ncbi:hypothetical protein CJF30_00008459 [Rutstroemia sp. NJR-2017a BBW]|nr:hypothetical protein CJF30_00008459 [Rutstroemia sp. NJR-2017a BBW]
MALPTRSKSMRSRFRGRDAVSPSAALHVTDNAQTPTTLPNSLDKFQFGGEDRHKLPERPKTSGGSNKSSANFPRRANTVKRETRDDLYFNPLTAHGKDGPTFYNFPLPAARPPPSPVPSRVDSLLRPQTPDSFKTTGTAPNLSVAEIGMALGSPEHPPENWQQAQKSFDMVTSPHHVDDLHDDAAPKQKGRWKLFGGMFRPKKEKTSASFYQLQPESQSKVIPIDPASPEYNDKRPTKIRERSRTTTKTAKKPEMKRSQTAPMTPSLPTFNATVSTSISAGTPEIRVHEGPIGVEVVRSYPTIALEGPKLDVDIPSVQMERYSVMFGSVLQKPSSTSSSLLQRRQATLDRLKSAEEALAAKEAELEARTKALAKRAASPQAGRNSPGFSLFPSTPSRQSNRDGAPSQDHQLHRSNTSPAALSPGRPSFAPGLDNDLHADLVAEDGSVPTTKHTHQRKRSSSSPMLKKTAKHPPRSSSSSPGPRLAVQQTRTWSPDESQLLSPSSEDSDIEPGLKNERAEENLYDASPLPAGFKTRDVTQDKEPRWQMMDAKGRDHRAPSSISGSTTSETSNSASSSHSTASFSSIPRGRSVREPSQVQGSTPASGKNIKPATSIVIPKEEKTREREARKESPTSIVSPRKDKETTTRIPVKSSPGPGPRPVISTFNTTTRTGAPRPILKSPVTSMQGLSPGPTSRPSLLKSHSNTSLTSISSPRPALQKSPLPIGIGTLPRPSHTNTAAVPVGTAISTPEPNSNDPETPPRSKHTQQPSTSSITPSLLDSVASAASVNGKARSGSAGAEDINVREGGKPNTPTLVVVGDEWGRGTGETLRDRVARKMEGEAKENERKSPVLERKEWEAEGGKLLLPPGEKRTEIGSGHQYRRSERALVVEI